MRLKVASVQIQVRFVREQPLAANARLTQGGYMSCFLSHCTSNGNLRVELTPHGGRAARIEAEERADDAVAVNVAVDTAACATVYVATMMTLRTRLRALNCIFENGLIS